jgi:hypothetical protein
VTGEVSPLAGALHGRYLGYIRQLKQGTTLHFDLSVHKVLEYLNLTDLRHLLRSPKANRDLKVVTSSI